MKKPLIGITSHMSRDTRGLYSKVLTNYSRSVIEAGGIPLILPQVEDTEMADEFLDRIDGLLLSGGEDILPCHYGEQPIKGLQYMNPDRDRWEIALTTRAIQNDMPLLGICRGHQMLNVALGGTLHQHVNEQKQTDKAHMICSMEMCHLIHKVRIEKGTLLADCFDDSEILVNSFHNQAIKDAAEGLTISSYSSDGLIEGVELPSRKFVMGVQWHPEALTEKYPQFLRLFGNFIRACEPS